MKEKNKFLTIVMQQIHSSLPQQWRRRINLHVIHLILYIMSLKRSEDVLEDLP